MSARRKKQVNLKMILICAGILVTILIMITLVSKLFGQDEAVINEKAKAKFTKTQEAKKKADLSGMSEQERMTYYCAEFFKKIDNGLYEEAYALLYTDYKENFFPTLDNFKKYFIDYFPSDFSLDYTNIERLGSIYVMWVSVKDTVNGSRYGKNFDMNVVVQENDLNDFVISFSRDSAVNNTREEE